MSKNKTAVWPYILSSIFFGTLIAFYFLNDSVREFFSEAWEVLRSNDEERISNWVEQFDFWGPLRYSSWLP